jgi:hypothetical protein
MHLISFLGELASFYFIKKLHNIHLPSKFPAIFPAFNCLIKKQLLKAFNQSCFCLDLKEQPVFRQLALNSHTIGCQCKP